MKINDPKDSLLLYIMAGQSNMAGRALIGPSDTITNAQILTMDTFGHFVTAKEPLHFYQPALSGLDCGVAFGNALLDYVKPNVKIGLIPCAVGSTSIEDWVGDSLIVIYLYSNLIARAKSAQKNGVLKGILWFQGEANAGDETYKKYGINLQLFILNLRRDLNNSDLPFFTGELSPFLKEKYTDSVNARIGAVAQTLPNVFLVETRDLTCKSDSVHFDANAQRILGFRFAQIAGALLH